MLIPKNRKGVPAVMVHVGDAFVNSLGSVAEGVATVVSAVTKLVAEGGPSINIRTTTNSLPNPMNQQKRKARNTMKIARENWEASKKAFLESQKRCQELEENDKIANDKFNAIELQLLRLTREDMSIVGG